MPIVPLFGAGTKGKSSNVTAQRRINLYAEMSPDPDKTPQAFYSRPGLVNWITTPSSASVPAYGGPWRGMWSSGENSVGASTMYGAQGYRSVISLSNGYGRQPLDSGEPPYYYTTDGFVDGVFGLSVDGASMYDTSVGDLQAAGITGIPYGFTGSRRWGPTSICSIGQRIVVTNNDPTLGTGTFNWSPVGWTSPADGNWDPLDFATAESDPDPLVAVAECNGDLVLFGNASTEFWRPVSTTAVFQRVGGSGIQWGLGSQASVAKWNQGLMFVGRNALGALQVCMMEGYQVRVVSTPDIEFIISNDPGSGSATAYTFTLSGHSWYVLNLGEKTLAYDITTNRWDEWQTDGGKFAGKFGVAAWGKFLVCDYRDGRIYYLDDETYTDDGETMVREITSRHVFTDLDRFGLPRMTLDIETGPVTPQLRGYPVTDPPVIYYDDPQVMLQVSKDKGHTFGNELWHSIGTAGDYAKQVVWRRIGMARDMVFKFRVATDAKVVILGANLEIDK